MLNILHSLPRAKKNVNAGKRLAFAFSLSAMDLISLKMSPENGNLACHMASVLATVDPRVRISQGSRPGRGRKLHVWPQVQFAGFSHIFGQLMYFWDGVGNFDRIRS